eukprot:5226484-Prymnesium_polylepis.1
MREAVLTVLAFAAVVDAVTIGFIHRVTSGGSELSSYWQGVNCAGLLAIKHANARNTSVVPQFASLTRNFTYVSTDSATSTGPSVTAYGQCRDGGAVGIVGPAISATSVSVATA